MKENDIYLILHEDNDFREKLITKLIKNGKKYHLIHLSTIRNKELYKRENIYSAIYHKVFSPFYSLQKISDYENIIGLTIQNYGKDKIGTILSYNQFGKLNNGIFFQESDYNNFINHILEYFSRIEAKKSLLLINGFRINKIYEQLEKIGIDTIEVSDNSLVRLFRFNHDQPSETGVETGNGISFNDKWYIIPYNSHQGTQKSIKITNIFLNKNIFQDVAQICFWLTKYHIGYSKNSMKLPFPIHYGKKLIKKMKNLDIRKLTIKYPIYL